MIHELRNRQVCFGCGIAKLRVSSARISWAASVFGLFLTMLLARLGAAQTPEIASVQFSGSDGNYSVLITGSGFGHSTVSLPYTGDVQNFRIGDSAQIGHGEWGHSGDRNLLTYKSWTDSSIVVSGLGASPGDALVLALWNEDSGEGATWGGNIPTRISAPVVIHSVEAEYSEEAQRARYQGMCLISLIVDTQGIPQNIRVMRPLGMGLDEKAVEAIRQYKFKPAMRDGKTPVPVTIAIEVDFKLY